MGQKNFSLASLAKNNPTSELSGQCTPNRNFLRVSEVPLSALFFGLVKSDFSVRRVSGCISTPTPLVMYASYIITLLILTKNKLDLPIYPVQQQMKNKECLTGYFEEEMKSQIAATAVHNCTLFLTARCSKRSQKYQSWTSSYKLFLK